LATELDARAAELERQIDPAVWAAAVSVKKDKENR
jgi:hypothetical protein